MNDPHVVSLTYSIQKRDTVDFDNASPLTFACHEYNITLDAMKAKIEMTAHCSSIAEAQEIVEPYLRTWEFWDDINNGNGLRCVFENARIIDRDPSPETMKVASGASHMYVGVAIMGEGHISRGNWPSPPPKLNLSPDACTLRERWLRCSRVGETILTEANFALTVIESYGPGRKKASSYYNIEPEVLSTLGNFTANRGGETEARKSQGRKQPLSSKERRWIEEVFKAIIIRVAEQAYYGNPPPKRLTMEDFPQL